MMAYAGFQESVSSDSPHWARLELWVLRIKQVLHWPPQNRVVWKFFEQISSEIFKNFLQLKSLEIVTKWRHMVLSNFHQPHLFSLLSAIASNHNQKVLKDL